MIKLKLDINGLEALKLLCVSILQICNESERKAKNIGEAAKYKAELFEVRTVKSKVEIQIIKMKNHWSKKTTVLRLTPTHGYILTHYWSKNIEPINNYNMVVVSDLSSSIYKQLTDM